MIPIYVRRHLSPLATVCGSFRARLPPALYHITHPLFQYSSLHILSSITTIRSLLRQSCSICRAATSSRARPPSLTFDSRSRALATLSSFQPSSPTAPPKFSGMAEREQPTPSTSSISIAAPASPSAAPTMPLSFYKRPLPDSCIPFASTKGKEHFRTALEEGHMEGYWGLAGQFLTQNEPAYCGLGTLCMVLNALEVDPQRKWREGAGWRWYEQEMLDCCRPLDAISKVGITLDEFAYLARCNGLRATVTSPSPLVSTTSEVEGLAAFRRSLKEASKAADNIMVLSYSRKSLGQTGDGHFSPVGGYSEQDDMILVLDVARFKYPSYWISVEDAWKAMLPLDKATGQPRGYAMLSPLPLSDPSSLAAPLSLTSLSLNKSSWASLSNSISKLFLTSALAANSKSPSTLMKQLATHLQSHPTPLLIARPSSSSSLSPLLAALKPSQLHQILFSDPNPTQDPLLPLFILALLSSDSIIIKNEGMSALVEEAFKIGGGDVRREVDVLKRQLSALGECCRSEGNKESECGCQMGK